MNGLGKRRSKRCRGATSSGWLAVGIAVLALSCESAEPAQTKPVPTHLLRLTPQPGSAKAPNEREEVEPVASAPARPESKRRRPPPEPVATRKANDADAGPGPRDADEPRASKWASAADLTVKRSAVTTRVVDREPVAVETLRLGAKPSPIVAFLELANASSLPARLLVTFVHEQGQEVGFVELAVPERRQRWRTWAETRRVQQAGRWEVVVRTIAGELLTRTAFEVAPAPEGAEPLAQQAGD